MAGFFDLSGLGELLKGGGDMALKIRQAVTGQDPEGDLKRLQLELNAAQSSDAAQGVVNLEEAKSSNFFVAGWRPAVGWICAAGLFYGTIGKPFIEFIAGLFGFLGPFPVIDGNTLNTTLFGMLGLGTLRTAEKIRGVAAK